MTNNPFISEQKDTRVKSKAEFLSKTSETLANDYLIDGDRVTTELLAELEQAQMNARTNFDSSTEQNIEALAHEAESAQEELEEGLAASLTEEAILNLFDGAPVNHKLPQLLNNERALSTAHDIIATRVNEMYYQAPVNFLDLERLRLVSNSNTKLEAGVRIALQDRVGNKFSEKLLNVEYVARLNQLQEFLKQKIEGMENVTVCEESLMSIDHLIAIHETLGTPENINDLISALDLKKDAPELEYEENLRLIQPAFANFDLESGELNSDITVGIRYGKEDSYLSRGFLHKPKKLADGTWGSERAVKHDVFRIQEDLGNRGIAKHMLKRSLDWYLDQNKKHPENPIAEIQLEANIDVGGYAWASYGFGWDKDGMIDRYRERTFNPKEENKNKSEREREIIFRNTVKDYVTSAKERFQNIAIKLLRGSLSTAEKQSINEILNEYDRALEDINSDDLVHDVTPQRLALIGKNGPRFIQDEHHDWYTEQQFNESKRSPAEDSQGPAHAGKFGMLGRDNRWYAKIELTESGSQNGKNLKLLQERLAK